MVGHQLVISLANYNNNLALQLYFNRSTTCYLEEVMMAPKNLLLTIQGCTCTPLHLPAAPMPTVIISSWSRHCIGLDRTGTMITSWVGHCY